MLIMFVQFITQHELFFMNGRVACDVVNRSVTVQNLTLTEKCVTIFTITRLQAVYSSLMPAQTVQTHLHHVTSCTVKQLHLLFTSV